MALQGLNLSILCMSLLSIIVSAASSAKTKLQGNETDRLSLLQFKAKIIEDPLMSMSSWNESIHFCQWEGITCGRLHRRVTVLNLQSRKLLGPISPHIGNLSFLSELNLQNNSLTDEIPAEIVLLRRLQIIILSNNSFAGQIPPNISSCINLVHVDFSNNVLQGIIPLDFGSLSKIRILIIQFNNLTGSISPLGNLSSLEKIYANENNFLGNIPASLGQLKNIEYIMLGENKFSGTIPPSIFNSSSITTLNFRENYQIEGILPEDLGFTLPNLKFLNIGNNRFTGTIPGSISNASNLLALRMSQNKLTGKVPNLQNLQELERLSICHNHLGSNEANDLSFISSLTNATNLKWLVLDNNNFGGRIPQSIGNLSTRLGVIYFENNQLHGSIPTEIGNIVSLQSIRMQNNHLTGLIPDDVGKLQNLQELYLMTNKLSGNVPSSLGNLSLLSELILDSNNLVGSIPPSLGKCKKLKYLSLFQNNLSGTVPVEVMGLSSLSIDLDLSQNRLTGSLPVEVGKLFNLGHLDVSDNLLSGEIPSTIGSCESLESLYMGGNFFSGAIPSSLRYLRAINDLDVSRNNLSGEIPEYFEDLKLLQNLNLSFNNFGGVVPRDGIFKNASAVSITGNDQLCGGVRELRLPRCIITESKKKKWSLTLILSLSILWGVLGLTSLLLLLYILCFRCTRKRSDLGSEECSLLKVSYQSLLKATDGFSSTNLVGVGSFGSVYKGVLDLDGSLIAVKVINLLHKGASKSFMAECEALRNIRHRNLLKVVTACSGIDYQGNDFKALVYEYMSKGSLEEWLHPCPKDESTIEDQRILNFLQRLSICIDVACALDYLHNDCQMPIVHCDLKPSNVLLDGEMTAHVGDFGLARFLPKATGPLSINLTSSVGVRGSIGYIAPEYGMGSEVSIYGDMYSFGILILEVFTGKRPSDDMFKDNLNLHNFAEAALHGRVTEVVDPLLFLKGDKDLIGTQTSQECLVSILKIGVACSKESPTERMISSEVLGTMQSIRNILTRTLVAHD